MDIAIAWRNIWRNKRRTYVILTAIFIGVSSMIFLASLMRGMMTGMVDNAINDMTGHIKIQHSKFREDPAITHLVQNPDAVLKTLQPILPPNSRAARRIMLDAVINTARESTGVQLTGIHYPDEKGLSFIGTTDIDGTVFHNDDLSSALMGRALCRKLGLKKGKRFVLTAQSINGEMASRSYTISGVFKGESEAAEKGYVFISRQAAAKLLGLTDPVTEIAIKLPYRDIAARDLRSLKARVNAALPAPLQAETWRDLLPAIDAYLSLFNQFLFIWYLVVFIAMGFGIVNTVLMAVFERMREFGLLKALGMKPFRIFTMVVAETLFLLGIGMVIGNAIGFSLIALFSVTGIDLSAFASGTEMWGMKRIIFPVTSAGDIIMANGTVFILGLIVGIYPAVKAAKFSPVETMRMT